MGRTQLNARVDDDKANRVAAFKRDQDIEENSEAVRKLLDEGLRNAGYPPNYQESSQQWLELARGMGSVLGLAALVLLGVGIYLGPAFSQYGLQLAVASIAFYAGAEVADRHGDAIYGWLKQAAKNEAEEWKPSNNSDSGGERE